MTADERFIYQSLDLDDVDEQEWAAFLARLVPALAPSIGAAT